MIRTPITFHQLKFLRKIELHGKAQRTPIAGFICVKKGWTKWADAYENDWEECLTDAGRDMLRQYRGVALRDLK
jgi:hypothetical protein